MISLEEYNRRHVKKLTEKEYTDLLSKELKMFMDSIFKPRKEEVELYCILLFVAICVSVVELLFF